MVKRLSVFIMTMLLGIVSGMAIPANKKIITVRQPDGSTVSIRLNGDEYLHFNTTADGYSIVKNNKGYYVYAELDEQGQLQPTTMIAHDVDNRKVAEQHFLSKIKKRLTPTMTVKASEEQMAERLRQAKTRRAAMMGAPKYNYNNFRGLVILVEFNDKPFSRSDYRDIMDDMINKQGYSGYINTSGSKEIFTGSVRDYFEDNSDRKFKPEFDVYGPYTINYSQYDGANSIVIVNAAIDAADADINFKDYDRDKNGYVDLIYFIFAGNGANFGGNDSRLFWPHRSVVYNPKTNSYLRKDNVTLWDYASSVELYGWTTRPQTVKIDGIGTICHEFSHVLGLPDFYDTDYEKSGGESATPGDWSLMASGSYFNDGRTPANYSLLERYGAGFATPQTITGEGSFTMESIDKSNTGYRINSLDKNEFFLLENRQNNKWDAYLPGHGMLVFRVDSSDVSVWESNTINISPSHNYYELVRAKGVQKQQGETYASPLDPFPGTGNVTELNNVTSPSNLITWSKKETQWGLDDIKESNGIISFDIVNQFVLKSVSLPEIADVYVGAFKSLAATLYPSAAEATLKWKSEDENVVTVDNNGILNGVSLGTTKVVVIANDTFSDTCVVSVKDIPIVSDIASIRNSESNNNMGVKLQNAQVLMVYNSDIYIRDASGTLVLSNSNISTKVNDVLNGVFVGKHSVTNKLHKMVASKEVDNKASVIVTEGSGVVPVVKEIQDVTEDDFGQLILLKNARMKQTSVSGLSGVYAYGSNNYVRIYNTFGLSFSMPSDYKTKPYDVTGILTPRVSGGKIIKELGFTREFVLSGSTAIESVCQDAMKESFFTLEGRRVENISAPGIYVVRKNNETRKLIVK